MPVKRFGRNTLAGSRTSFITRKAIELLTIPVERRGAVAGKEELAESLRPVFDDLRSKPRFPDSLKRVGPAPDRFPGILAFVALFFFRP